MSTNPKLKVINNHAYANSLDLAKHFHKSHKNVLQTIQNILSDLKETERNEFSLLNFQPRNYKNQRGQFFPFYELTRDAFALVAMSFTGVKALQWKIRYIEAFNEMETELNRRAMQAHEFGQLKFHFPELAESIEDARPSMTVSYAVARLTELGLMIPPVSRRTLINLIKRRSLDGFNDGRQWHIYAKSFSRFVKLRSVQFA